MQIATDNATELIGDLPHRIQQESPENNYKRIARYHRWSLNIRIIKDRI